MAALEAILVTVAALLPIVNPLGSAPIFLAHSADLPPAARTHLAWVVARNALLLLVAAMLAGSYVLAFFGISIPIVRVAGGLVVLATGWQLLHAGDELDAPPAATSDAWRRETARRGFYPLTFPLTVGPGSISVAITLGAGAALDRPAGLLRVGAYRRHDRRSHGVRVLPIGAETWRHARRDRPKRVPPSLRIHPAVRRRRDLLEWSSRTDPVDAVDGVARRT